MTKEAGAPTQFRALWLGGANVRDAERVVAVLDLLVAAAKEASARWGRVYDETPVVEVVYPGQEAPTDALIDAAGSTGCRLLRRDATVDFLAPQCDLAIVPVASDLPRVGSLPAIIMASDVDEAPRFDLRGASLVAKQGRNSDLSIPASPRTIAAAFAPPRAGEESRKLIEYLAEPPDQRVGRHAYDLLLFMIGESSRPSSDASDDSWDRALDLVRQTRPGAAGAIEGLESHYVRADALAIAYGQRWRSTLVARSLLLLLVSIGSGMIGTLYPPSTIVTIPFQIIATVLIFFDRRHSQRNHWREKWIEYRRLAEVLRTGRLLVLCGVPHRWSSETDWVNWMHNRVTGASPSFEPLQDADAPAVLERLAGAEIGEQIAYHQAAFRRFRRLDRGFRRAANISLFILIGFAIVLGGLALTPSHHFGPLSSTSLLSALSFALSGAPSLFGAMNNVRRELDVVRQGTRSAKVAAGLKRLTRDIAAAPHTAAVARAVGFRAVEIMNEAVFSWSSVVSIL
ncbi:MAG TPA: hypothetical protein VKS78_04695 [Roseiarcus sp.]|nr:hypothetical protein [Roseiarcus sp.]